MPLTAPAPTGVVPNGLIPSRRRRRLSASGLVLAVVASAALTAAAPSTAGAADGGSVARGDAGPAGWSQVGVEDFSRFDRSRWHVYDGRGTTGSTDHARPWRAFVRGGALRLTSGRDSDGRWSSGIVGGWAWDVANRSSGRIDMRVMNSRGGGTATNLMMWPDEQAGLPALGLFTSPSTWAGRKRVQQGSHYRTAAGALSQRATTRRADTTSWRTVSVRWNADAVTYVLDGKVTRVDTTPGLLPEAKLWPLLQTTVHRDEAGRMPRSGRGSTTSIDWIRVYAWDEGDAGQPDPGTDPQPEPQPNPQPNPQPQPQPQPNPQPQPQPQPNPQPQPEPQPNPQPSGWTSVGRDDFNGTQLDTSRWSPFSGTPGCCKDTTWNGSQVEVSNGELVLHNRQDSSGKWLSGGVGAWKWKDTVQSEGRIDARLRFDKGTGFSAAALAWPANNTWPPEIDFYEVFETRGNRDKMMQSTHYKDASSSTGRGIDQKSHTGDFSQWKTVSVRWDRTELTYWIDGVKVHTITDAKVIPNTPMWVGFQTHTHKMDGAWPTMPAGQDTVAFRVDWVEVFKKS